MSKIRDTLIEAAAQRWAGRNSHEGLIDAFIAGAEWADNDPDDQAIDAAIQEGYDNAVEVAAKWLDTFLERAGLRKEWAIDAFKKAVCYGK